MNLDQGPIDARPSSGTHLWILTLLGIADGEVTYHGGRGLWTPPAGTTRAEALDMVLDFVLSKFRESEGRKLQVPKILFFDLQRNDLV